MNSLDFTVFSGTPTISAISWYESSAKCRSTTTARSFAGSVDERFLDDPGDVGVDRQTLGIGPWGSRVAFHGLGPPVAAGDG